MLLLRRFQFVSLAHFLVQTVFPERYGGSTEPSLLIEREIGGWDAFYKVSIPCQPLPVTAAAAEVLLDAAPAV